MERRRNVKTIEVRYICDECGSIEVEATNMTLWSYPPQYPHVCKMCGKGYTFMKTYPYVEYEYVNEDTVYD